MTGEREIYYLNKIRQRFQIICLVEIALWSAAIACIVFLFFIFLASNLVLTWVFTILIALIVFILLGYRLEIFRITDRRLVRYLNTKYPELHESIDLLLTDDQNITSLQYLQKARTVHQFNSIYPSIKVEHRLFQASLAFVLCTLATVTLLLFFTPVSVNTSRVSIHKNAMTESTPQKHLPAAIQGLSINIIPPSYTRMKPFVVSNPTIESVPEGSSIEWLISFTNEVQDPRIVFSGRDTMQLSTIQKNKFRYKRKFTESGFYQLLWSDGETFKSSDFYRIEVKRDHGPKISIEKIPQFTALTYKPSMAINLEASLNDDYGLTEAHIIATVSKGSGESVKFREEKINFTKPEMIQGKNINASRKIDLLKLGMEPGDELYFYVEAVDNKLPAPNITRTETFFIALQDTASENLSIETGLGVDLMPEYFRSQRQIIIDTEKLLREKKDLGKNTFNSRSNELGYDQKVLRLRYGQFLGEEFESEIVQGSEHDEQSEETEENIEETFGHKHDTENEHNLVEEKKSDPLSHQHEESPDPEKKEDPLEAFIHKHDDSEQATFFIKSIRAKLKAAVTVMWDAELYLRLYEPEKSLPYQYQALKLLKEISNDSRIYVHKTGFDPPPLKEDKRLTGELNDIKSSFAQYRTEDPEKYPYIRHAVQRLETLLQQKQPSISTADKELLRKAGTELSAEVLSNPAYLETLSALKTLAENDVDLSDVKPIILKVRNDLWKILPNEPATLHNISNPPHPLDHTFMQILEDLKQ